MGRGVLLAVFPWLVLVWAWGSATGPAMLAAEPHWTRVQQGGVELSSDAGEKSARETLRYFQQVRGLLTPLLPAEPPGNSPVHVVQFNSRKEYQPYRPEESSIAHSHRTGEADYVVLSGTAPDVVSAGIQAFVQLSLDRAGLKSPPWLIEGLANLYSTLKITGDQATVGILPALDPSRGTTPDKWLPLGTLLASAQPGNAAIGNAAANSKGARASDAPRTEAWVLVHMLALGADYKSRFPELVDRIRRGSPSDAALTAVYERSLTAIEKDLRLYLRNGRFQGVTTPAATAESIEVRAELAFDVKLMLIDLINGPGRETEVKQKLGELSAEDPARPEPHVELGLLEQADNHLSEARLQFDKAFALGGRDAKMLWIYGQMLAPADPRQSTRVLGFLLDAEPDRADVRLTLAAAQFDAQLPAAALETLKPVKNLTPQDTPRFFKITALAQAAVGNTGDAAQAAERWAGVAETPEDSDEVDRFLAYLDGLHPGEKPNIELVEEQGRRSDAEPGKQQSPGDPASGEKTTSEGKTGGFLTTGSVPPASPETRITPRTPPRPSVSGTFAELDCAGTQALVVLQTNAGNQIFLIEDPRKILISGERGVTLDLTCGPQKASAATVEYDPPDAAHPDVQGLVRSIHIEPR